MGYSEGLQVAPKIEELNKKVTSIVCFAGNAINQLYDFIIEARPVANRNKKSSAESKKIVASLYKEFEKIYANPAATDKTWFKNLQLFILEIGFT